MLWRCQKCRIWIPRTSITCGYPEDEYHMWGTSATTYLFNLVPKRQMQWSNFRSVWPPKMQTLCKLHTCAAASYVVNCFIRRLHLKHLALAHSLADLMFSMIFCIPAYTSVESVLVWMLTGHTVHIQHVTKKKGRTYCAHVAEIVAIVRISRDSMSTRC